MKWDGFFSPHCCMLSYSSTLFPGLLVAVSSTRWFEWFIEFIIDGLFGDNFCLPQKEMEWLTNEAFRLVSIYVFGGSFGDRPCLQRGVYCSGERRFAPKMKQGVYFPPYNICVAWLGWPTARVPGESPSTRCSLYTMFFVLKYDTPGIYSGIYIYIILFCFLTHD